MNRRHAVILLTALGMPAVPWAVFAAPPEQKFPDVVGVKVRASANRIFDFDVTVSSPYDSAARYADAFRARTKDGVVYGERKLLHDHATEQPFTRDLYGVRVPAGIRSVVIEARDQKHGYGGKIVEIVLPGH